MTIEKTSWRDDLAAIEQDLSHGTHELANLLNEMLLHAAVVQASVPEPFRKDLGRLQVLGRQTNQTLHAIQSTCDRLRQVRATKLAES